MPDNPQIDKDRYDNMRSTYDPVRGSALLDLSTTDATCPAGQDGRLLPWLGLRVEGAGDVKFDSLDGNTDTWTVAAHTTIPVVITKVYKTGTTAARIHGLT